VSMGKKTKNPSKIKKQCAPQPFPFVSVCTPTFNRRPFIPTMFEIFKNQDYPKDRLEWIIVDDGTDPIEDLIEQSGIPQIKYHKINEKMSLGKKRNYMHSLVKPNSNYIIYFDDDDWYPHDRISHSVEMLEKNPSCMIAGSSELYCYFKGNPPRLVQFGPYGPTHSTAGTFCFRTQLLTITKYNDDKELAEEKDFLKDYTISMCQLDPIKTILVFSHEHNTFDKRILLIDPNPQFVKTSEKTVDAFFRKYNETDQKIRRFFMEEIDELLKGYDPGEPKHKPNVLKQINEIKEERENAMAEQRQTRQTGQQVIIQRTGHPPKTLTVEEIIQLLREQQSQIEYLSKHSQSLEQQCNTLQLKLSQFAQTSR
jgi:glycosyltransferase involved in cell wall biosynthesis